ncbi:MAG: hypothetical protein AB1815_00115 [Bacillota bacterium]
MFVEALIDPQIEVLDRIQYQIFGCRLGSANGEYRSQTENQGQ